MIRRQFTFVSRTDSIEIFVQSGAQNLLLHDGVVGFERLVNYTHV